MSKWTDDAGDLPGGQSWVGQPLERVDARDKVTGRAKYSAEVPVAGVAYAVMVTSAIAKGRIVDIDASAALKVPGVFTVLTHKNALKLPGAGQPADPGDRVVQVLQDDRILFSNQPVALVVADTFERATHAAFSVRVQTEVQAFTVRMEDELPHATTADVHRASGTVPGDDTHGRPDEALKAAQVILAATYETPPEVHNPMEPHATLAVWSGRDHLTVYDATQGIFGVRKKLAKNFGLPAENIRVITKYVGGGFGCKGSVWSHVLLAALAAKQLELPIKLVLTRPQMFGPVGGRPRTRQALKLGAAANGKLEAIDHRCTTTTSRFDEFLEPAALVSRHLYACKNIATSHRLVRLDTGTPTYMRAPGESTGTFALESAMDELAHRLKVDPIELRVRNHADVDPSDGKPFSSKSLKQCYTLAAERFGWAERKKRAESTRESSVHVGVGMATATYPANMSEAQAVATLSPEGRLLVKSGAVDIGGGTYTVMRQVAADALGLSVKRVDFDLGDTQFPEAPRSGGSQTAASVASAVLAACEALRGKLVHLAVNDVRSPLYAVAPAEVTVTAGKLTAGPREESLLALLKRSAGGPVEARADIKPPEERKRFALHAFGAQLAEVEVDELGLVRVRRMVGAFAFGQPLNARLARSQLMGGMVWGIGMALHEQAAYDETLGRIMSRDLSDYHVPTHADAPDIEPYIVEEKDPHVNPAGVKGVGELGICGAAAAIANAVFHATGKRVRELPITPDKLI
jgi:xanthine dehydrogenase YagR molybdenum-binding subunit